MSNNSTKKAPGEGPASNKPVAKAVEEVVQKKDPREGFVAPMHGDAFNMAMQIVNASDMKGGNAEAVVLLKRELARVAGKQYGQPRA